MNELFLILAVVVCTYVVPTLAVCALMEWLMRRNKR